MTEVRGGRERCSLGDKKADVAKSHSGIHHVGLLDIAPAKLNRSALLLVVRNLSNHSANASALAVTRQPL